MDGEASITDIYIDSSYIEDDNILFYWVGKLYLDINYILRRNISIDKQYKQTPNLFIYVYSLIQYFKRKGLNKQQLLDRGIKYLFRGLNKKFLPFHLSNVYSESSFLSTSYKRRIAQEEFAKIDGVVCVFDVTQFNDSDLFVKVKISKKKQEEEFPVKDEKEILLLPGSITKLAINEEGDNIVKYMENTALINEYLKRRQPKIVKMLGGREDHNKQMIAMKGKYLVFYRAIYNSPPEVVGSIRVPTDNKKFGRFMQYTIHDRFTYYDGATELIPEVAKLRELVKNDDIEYSKFNKIYNKLMSFKIHAALYNQNTKEVERINALTPESFHREIFDYGRRDEVIAAIVTGCCCLD